MQPSSMPMAARSSSVRFAAVVDATCVTRDRKSTRLNSSHLGISYAVFCLKKKKKHSIKKINAIHDVLSQARLRRLFLVYGHARGRRAQPGVESQVPVRRSIAILIPQMNIF